MTNSGFYGIIKISKRENTKEDSSMGNHYYTSSAPDMMGGYYTPTEEDVAPVTDKVPKTESNKDKAPTHPTFIFKGEDIENLHALSEVELRHMLGLPINDSNVFDTVMTKEQAQRILQTNNTHNRHISNRHVALLRRDMDNGQWHRSGDDFAFSPEGLLVNGQHRLTAFTTSTLDTLEVTVKFKVDNFLGMDTGKVRSMTDNIMLFEDVPPFFKQKNIKSIMEVVKAYTRICTGYYCWVSLSQNELMDVANAISNKLFICNNMGLLDRSPYTGVAPIRAAYIVALQSNVSPDLLRAVKIALDTGVMTEPEVERFIPPAFAPLVIHTRDRLLQMKTDNNATAQKVYLVENLIDKIDRGVPASYMKNSTLPTEDIEFKYSAKFIPHIDYSRVPKKKKRVEGSEE